MSVLIPENKKSWYFDLRVIFSLTLFCLSLPQYDDTPLRNRCFEHNGKIYFHRHAK